METRPLAGASIDDLATLFGADRSADGCWCMWFIRPVKDYHAAGGAGNRASFTELSASGPPMGVLGYLDGRPAAWCAAGPRSRYARAIRTPTYKGRDPAEDDDVWLIPCIFVGREARGSGASRILVRAAVELARAHGASAVEAFPFTGEGRRSTDTQVGFERAFAGNGFRVLRRPSPSRVLMRLEIAAKGG